MNKLPIRNLTLYSFLILLISIMVSFIIMFYYLSEIRTLDSRLQKLSNAHNSFLKLKLNTERLLTTITLEETKKTWKETIENFNKAFVLLPQKKKEKIDELWYVSKKEIIVIEELLNKKVVSPINLQTKPILTKQGEIFVKGDNSLLYFTLQELTKKIEYLIQYESFILDEFDKMEKIDINHIRRDITTTIYYATFFPLIILLITLFFIVYTTRKTAIMEKNLLDTKETLESTILQEKDTRLLINNIINSLEVAIFWKDINGIFMGANNFFLHAAGLQKPDDILGKSDFDMPWAQKEAQNYINDDNEVLKTGKPRLNFEETQTTPSGDTIYLLTSKVPLTNTKGEKIGILGSYLDITEQKKSTLELTHKNKLLAQQSKMAAMGEMLENIAHQWRQPLSVISTASSGLKMQKQFGAISDDSLYKTLDIITHTVEHLSQTINDFRDYFNPNKTVVNFDLKNIIEKTLYFVQSKLQNRNISIIKEFESIELLGLENELVQVIINILNNSRDAFENSSIIEDKLIFITTMKDEKKDYVYITIQDSAGGIPQDILNRVFEPYFTTKHKSQGTGIGLYMSQEMIEKHMNGELHVENRTFQYNNKSYTGALFTIKIPLKMENI